MFTKDVVGRRMAGPGIRAFHLARELRVVATTTLIATPEQSEPGGIEVLDVRSSDARAAIADAEVVIGQPSRQLLSMLRGCRARTIFDLFDPTLVELDELQRGRFVPRIRLHRLLEEWRLRRVLSSGDRLICATPQQRDYYDRLAREWGIEREIEWLVVPFGVEAQPLDGSGGADRVPLFIWNGGRWPWLDVELAGESVRELRRDGIECKLLILGGRRPDEKAEQSMVRPDESVEYHDAWVPYRERGSWLRRARAAVMLHRDTPEAELSIRTRFFDAVWAGLPVIASRGGWVAELVEREKLGIVVMPESGQQVRDAMARLIGDDAFHSAAVFNLERLRPRFAWSRVVAPLAEAARKLINE